MREFHRTVLRNPWIPQRPTPKQAEFLLTPRREALYGGAAGGGKTSALLMAAAQYVDEPGYAALLLRRTFRDLNQPDALIPRSKEWWAGRASWNGTDHRWTFPSGATVTFGYLKHDDDVLQYQGAAYATVVFDELTQFPESSYRYLFSRQRRPRGSRVPVRMRSGSNPGGRGNEWVRKRFLEEANPDRCFVPARLHDNPHLDAEEYVASLANLDPITRAQLLAGDWNAYLGGRFKREWFKTYALKAGGPHGRGEYHLQGGPTFARSDCWVFLTCDPAASSEETAASDDPDYTVVSAWAVTPRNDLLWLDCHRFRLETPDIVPQVQSVYSLHGALYVGIEAVAANRAVFQIARRTGMAVKELTPGGRDKLVRATPAMVLAESGRLFVPASAHWLEEALGELLRFTGDDRKDAHDDVVDSAAWAALCLAEHDGGDDALPLSLGSARR